MNAILLSIPFALAVYAGFFAGPVAGAPPVNAPLLVFPVDCRIGESCLIQKLVDHDPGPGRRDYRCGALTTDGHDGIDIRLRTMAEMHAGRAVLAARGGTVLRVRDGEPDISVAERAGLDGKLAGNAVVIDHGDGWETQYSHLRRGSVAVHPGQQVAAGDRIGLIGLSGNSEFPHLHFAVRHRGEAIDPFVGPAPVAPCVPDAVAAGLWTPAAASMLGYRPTAVIAAGLASAVPPKAVTARDPPAGPAGRETPLILWVDAMGAKAGDRQSFSITGPDGRVVHSQQSDVEGGGLSWFAYSGRRAPPGGWPRGRYVGRYVLHRGPDIVAQAEASGPVQ